MSSEPDHGSRAVQIAAELSICRGRGIERLDVTTHNQVPVPVPHLERLASDYAVARDLSRLTRGARIKTLIRDATENFESEGEPDAELIRDLFFGDATGIVTRTAGELLDIARRKHNADDKARFRAQQMAAFHNFARFLPRFVISVHHSIDRDTNTGTYHASPDQGHLTAAEQFEPDVESLSAVAGLVGDGERFIRRLSEADSVTIVGFTNEGLAAMLETALARKRDALGKPNAFWDSLRVVFPSDELIGITNDEPSEYPDRAEAVKQRKQAAAYGQRSVSVFLRRMGAAGSMYISSGVPRILGTLFEMPRGRRVLQYMVRHPERSSRNDLFFEVELSDHTASYFASFFEATVRNSVNYKDVVPVGHPSGQGFLCTGTRFQHGVLKDGSGATDWLPVVLVVTWRRRNEVTEPLLQLRTVENAARELNRFSHLSGHIIQDDYSSGVAQAVDVPTAQRVVPPIEFDMYHEGPARAAWRRVQFETGETTLFDFGPYDTFRYLHWDKENLYFFVYSCRFDDDFQPPRNAEMHPVPLPRLLALRERQVLLKASELRQASVVPPWVGPVAWRIVGLNLLMHGHTEIGLRLTETTAGPSDADLAELDSLLHRVNGQIMHAPFPGRPRVPLIGLSGMQYREFFTMLLPLYARIGIPGAAHQLELMDADNLKRDTRARLADLYQDEDLMRAIPIEL